MIDDDQRLADMVAQYLQHNAMELAHCADAASGLARLQQPPLPELLILDLMLPDADGLQVCRQLRAQPGALGQLPVLMLTAKGDPMDRVVGLEVGADDYLPKPFEPRELLARIRAILRRKQATSATGGLAAPVLSTAEDAASFSLAAAAIIVPIVAGLLLIGLIITVIVLMRRWRRRREAKAAAAHG